MKKTTIYRIGAVCLLVAASLIGGIIGEYLHLSFTCMKNHGYLPAISSLYRTAVCVEGFALFSGALPGLLVLLIYLASRPKLTLLHILLQFACAILFMFITALSYLVLQHDLLAIAAGGITSFIIALGFVIKEKHRPADRGKGGPSQ